MTVDKSGERVQRMFGEIAARYDLLNHLLSLNVDRLWRRQTVRRVQPCGTAPILDVCTGTGDLALAYRKQADPDATVIAADFCHPMLTIGNSKGREAGYKDNLIFVEADAQQLPFSNDQFQIVSVAFGLRNVADTDCGLRELARVCRPEGRVAILEFSMPTWQPFRALYGWYFRNVLPRIGQLLARNKQDAYNYLPQSVGEFPQGEALAVRMKSAGLREVQYFPLTFGVATLYVGIK
jgi:demethylmenaquinone methyltransferase/2-methoxy-6-polyprenyl-1,4-benzoquinol methylase